MLKKIFSHEFKTLTGAALVLAFASFLSRIMGIIRDRILAHQFGAGSQLDIYSASFRIPDFLYNIIIVGAVSAGFIPIFLELYKDKKQEAFRLTSTLMVILGTVLAAISLLLILFLPYCIDFLVTGFSPEAKLETIKLTRIMLVSPLLLGLSAVVSSVLQALKNFSIYSLTPIFYNLGIILGAIYFAPRFGLSGLAYGVILGAALHLLIQIPSLFQKGFRFTPTLPWNHPSLLKLWRFTLPRTFTLGVNQINVLGLTFFISTLPAGSLTIFTFANNIQYLPIGMIGVSFALAAFPTLSELAIEKKWNELSETIQKTSTQILFFIIPITILFILLRAQIVRVLLGSGAFDWNDTILTFETLTFFCIGLFAQCLIPLFIRVFYALENTTVPLLSAFIGVLSTLLGTLVLKNSLGTSGVALAVTLGGIIQFVFLWHHIHISIPQIKKQKLLKTLASISIAALIMGFVVQGSKYMLGQIVNMDTFWGILCQGVISGIIGILIYLGASFLLKIEEMMNLVQTFQKKWLKIDKSIKETPGNNIQ